MARSAGNSSAQRHVNASPEVVWDVLSDGHRYHEWVVGTRDIRAVDAGWPAEGAEVHFTVGYGPLKHKDKTVVRAAEPPRRLELEAYAWPAGTARVGLFVDPEGDGSRVTIDEHPLRGPAGHLHNPLSAVFFAVRGRLILRRLAALAEQRD